MDRVSASPSLDQVIVVPRNGYVNRLQAWASAAILAAHADAPLRILWEPEAVAPARAPDLFSPLIIERSFIERPALDALLGGPHEELPRYLTAIPDRRVTVLAGHDRGEQEFMEAVAGLLESPSGPRTLVIIAGGKFRLPGPEDFVRQRQVFYRQLKWSPALDELVRRELDGRPEYAGLHIRMTDRARESPTPRAIRQALARLRDDGGPTSLFLAADTGEGREHWSAVATELGFEPWTASGIEFDRSTTTAGLGAMVDWRILGGATRLVYSAASSFAEEAAVATGDYGSCIALASSAARQRTRAAGDLGRALVTYPRRHGWLG